MRIVENLTFMPVTKESGGVEPHRYLPAATGDDGLYKIWPKEPMEPGEYAVVQYTEGKLNIQIWDFAIARAK